MGYIGVYRVLGLGFRGFPKLGVPFSRGYIGVYRIYKGFRD